MPEEPLSSAGAVRGEDVVVDVQVSWQEAQQGCARIVRVGEINEKIDIPSGVKNGQAIWFPGRGLAGLNGGRPGNLSVRLDVEPEPKRGEDLETCVEVLPEEAARGTSKSVRSGDQWVVVSVPAGATEGQVIRLPGRGAPGAHNGPSGDLLITVEFASILPVAASDDPREIERHRSSSGERIRFSPMLLVGGVALAAVVGGLIWQGTQQKGTAASAGGSSANQGAVIPISAPRYRSEIGGAPTVPVVPAVQTLKVCADSGLLPTEDCPATESRRLAAQDAPQKTCTEHRAPARVQVLVCASSGLRPSAHCPRKLQRTFDGGEAPGGICRTHKAVVTAPAARPSRTRYCGACGAAVRGDIRFCGGCGRSL